MEGSTVPEFGLEYLLGSYCSSNDEVVIAEGLQTAKNPCRELRPARRGEKVESTVRERGSLKVIDKVTVILNEKRDIYEGLPKQPVKGIEVPATSSAGSRSS
jgi:ATP-dependent Lon protease